MTFLKNTLAIFTDTQGHLGDLEDYGSLNNVLSSKGDAIVPIWQLVNTAGSGVWTYGTGSLVELDTSFAGYTNTGTFVFPLSTTEHSGSQWFFSVENNIFRAGLTDASQWTLANCAANSVSFGHNNQIGATYGVVRAGGSHTVAAGGITNTTIGGGSVCSMTGNYATVMGGLSQTTTAAYAVIFGGASNTVNNNGVVVGGLSNHARWVSSVCCGASNTIQDQAEPMYSIIGAGNNNSVFQLKSGIFAGISNVLNNDNFCIFIGAGDGNILTLISEGGFDGTGSCCLAGSNNLMTSSDRDHRYCFQGAGTGCQFSESMLSSCLGGDTNLIVDGVNCCIGGGKTHVIGQTIPYTKSAIFCGDSNIMNAGGDNCIIMGGSGMNSTGESNGTTILCGSTHSLDGAGSQNSVVLGGSGCSLDGVSSIVGGTNVTNTQNGSFVFSDITGGLSNTSVANRFVVGVNGGAIMHSDSDRSLGVTLASGGSAWASVSDRNQKENIQELNYSEVLQKIAVLPIYEFSYKNTDPAIRWRGPMAQDWYESFPNPKKDNLKIDTMDLDGIKLAVAKELVKLLDQLEQRIVNRVTKI